MLFLPVNIETRFMTSAAGAPELWVRIYPDQIAIDSHEPELTAQEIADGTGYWDAVWRAGKPPPSIDDDEGAVARPGIALRRAARGVDRLADDADQPRLAARGGDAGRRDAQSRAPAYPTPPTRTASWTKPAITEALPDAWTVVTVSRNAQPRCFAAARSLLISP